MVRWDDLKANAKETFQEFKKHKIGWVGVGLIVFVIIMGILAPYLAPGVQEDWGRGDPRWRATPSNSPPVWYDWITRDDYHRHEVIDEYEEEMFMGGIELGTVTPETEFFYEYGFREEGEVNVELFNDDLDETIEERDVEVEPREPVENVEITEFEIELDEDFDEYPHVIPMDLSGVAEHTDPDAEENATLELEIGGEVIDDEDHTWEIPPGEEELIDVEHIFDQYGLYSVVLSDHWEIIQVGTDVLVTEMEAEEIEPGVVEIEAFAENLNLEEEQELALVQYDVEEELYSIQEEWTIEPGEEEVIMYTQTFAEEGDYDLILGREREGPFVYREPDDPATANLAMEEPMGENADESEEDISLTSNPDIRTQVFDVPDSVEVGDVYELNAILENHEEQEYNVSFRIDGETERTGVLARSGSYRGYRHTFEFEMDSDVPPTEVFFEYAGEASFLRARYITVERPDGLEMDLEIDDRGDRPGRFEESVTLARRWQVRENIHGIPFRYMRNPDFLFNISREDHRQHLEEGPMADELMQAFEAENYDVDPDAELAGEYPRWWVYEDEEAEFIIEIDDEDIFNIDRAEFEPYLEDGPVHENIRAVFEEEGIELGEDAEVVEEDDAWIIVEDGKEKYVIALDHEHEFNLQTIQYEEYLEEGPIHENLSEAFAEEGIALDEDAELEEENGNWLITVDGEEKYLLIVGPDEIEIFEWAEELGISEAGDIEVFRPGVPPAEIPDEFEFDPLKTIFSKQTHDWLFEYEPLKGTYNFTVQLEGMDVELEESQVTFGGAVYGVLGTDSYRRDIFQGWVWGARWGIIIGGLVAIAAISIGTIFGMTSAYYGGWIDEFMQRINEIVMGIPTFPILIVTLEFMDRPNIWAFTAIYVLLSWRGIAKVVRARGLQVAKETYVEAAESLGSGSGRVIMTHMVPQILPYSIATGAMLVPVAIMAEAGLHMLGLGDPRVITWGTMLEEAYASGAILNPAASWFWVLFPGLGMLIVGFGFISAGMAIERIINPKMRQR